ncbi:hypothetical protein ACFVRB_13295 [Streptomyces nojiriensis]|uniref:hypothetical protein n=1 Tax=Streptomyces nojiriensis TaxID=66374 RepID=UPI0036D84E74
MPTLFGRGRAASAVPVPHPDHPEPYGRKSLERTGRAVFATLPAQVTGDRDFDPLLAEFDADPQKLATRRRGPAVGTGISVADLTVYVLPAVAWVLGVVGERVTGRAADALSETARAKAAVLLGRLRQRGTEPPEEPAPAPTAEPRTAWSADERAAFVTAFQILFVQRLGLEADPAEALAEAIATALDDPPQGGAGS